MTWQIVLLTMEIIRANLEINNKMFVHIYTHDYIRMEITVLYLKISRY